MTQYSSTSVTSISFDPLTVEESEQDQLVVLASGERPERHPFICGDCGHQVHDKTSVRHAGMVVHRLLASTADRSPIITNQQVGTRAPHR